MNGEIQFSASTSMQLTPVPTPRQIGRQVHFRLLDLASWGEFMRLTRTGSLDIGKKENRQKAIAGNLSTDSAHPRHGRRPIRPSRSSTHQPRATQSLPYTIPSYLITLLSYVFTLHTIPCSYSFFAAHIISLGSQTLTIS